MSNSLLKVSDITNIDPSIIGSGDLIYFVHQAPGQFVSASLKFSDFFIGTNNITSDVKFNNNSLYIKSNKVGINKIPSENFDVYGTGAFSGSLYVGGILTVNSNENVLGTLSVIGNTSIQSGLTVSGSTTISGSATIGSALTVNSNALFNSTLTVSNHLTVPQIVTTGGNLNIASSATVVASLSVGANLEVDGSITMAGREVDAFPAGTTLVFNQSNAPLGWTKVTTYDDFALRVVSGSVGTGGSVAFSSAFSSHTMSGTTDGHTLTIAEMPTHNHDITDPSHTHAFNVTQGIPSSAGPHSGGYNDMNQQTMTTLSTSVGVTGITINNQGGGAAHTHPFTSAAVNIAVKYVDVILCQKN